MILSGGGGVSQFVTHLLSLLKKRVVFFNVVSSQQIFQGVVLWHVVNLMELLDVPLGCFDHLKRTI